MAFPTTPLGDVCPAKPLKTITGLRKEDIWQLNLDQIEADSGVVLSKHYAPINQAGNSTHWFDERHVLYSKLRPYLNKVVLPDEVGIATTELVPLLPDDKRLDRKYLAYYLRSKSFVSWVNQHVDGAKMPRVSMKTFWDHEIPLPPLKEQKRIVAALDKADGICRKRQKAIQLADQFLRAVFLDMFGDPVTNPKGWEVKKFRDVGTLDRGKSKHRPRNDPALLGGAHPLIQTGDVANSNGYIREYKSTYSEIGLKQSKKWPKGTLCITIAANIAKTGILTFDACFPDSVVGFTANKKATVEYVQSWLGFLQKNLEAHAPESAQKNINLAILRELDIPVPDIDLQKKFSDFVEKILANSDRFLDFTTYHDDLFSSLNHKAFAGEL